MTSNNNRTLHLRRPNGVNANAAGNGAPAPAAPQPMPQAAPQSLVTYNNFLGITAAFQLAPGFYQIDYTSVAATADLYLEAADLKGAFSGARCLNVTHSSGGSGLTLGSGGNFRLNNAGLGVASVTLTLSGP
jgi:hypothetical protein